MEADRLRRREFTTLLGGAAAWPHAVLAQQPSLRRIGCWRLARLHLKSYGAWFAELVHRLHDLGWIEARRWCGVRGPRAATAHQVTVIAATMTAAAPAAKGPP
jgi:hypothetical protein